VRSPAVIRCQRRWIFVDRKHRAHPDINSLVVDQVAYIAERKAIDPEYLVQIGGAQYEIMPSLLHCFRAAKYRIFEKIVIAFKKERVRALAVRTVLSPDKGARPVMVFVNHSVVNGRSRRLSENPHLRFQRLGFF
jgi:hypothetical protein